MSLAERMIKTLFEALIGVDLGDMPVISYQEAMSRYGTDRPDLRFDLPLVDIGDLMQDVEFKVFSGPANEPRGRVAALRLPDGQRLTRKAIDDLTQFVGIYGAKGLAYIKVNALEDGIERAPVTHLEIPSEAVVVSTLERLGAGNGDIVFFGADRADVVNASMGALRAKLGEDLSLYEADWAACWVVDFPMFEASDEGAKGGKAFSAVHHPFTHPLEPLRRCFKIQSRRSRGRTIWSSTALRLAEARSGCTNLTGSRLFLMCSVCRRKRLLRSLGSCWMHWRLARHPMGVSPLVWIGWLCCSLAPRRLEM